LFRSRSLTPRYSSVNIESMNVELTPELRRRAAVHAALSDPQRLVIVDQLVLGDASPTRLRELLGMPSNLLAHHLRVLEEAGLLTRTRSEGDRRRSYVKLDASYLDGLLPATASAAARVVFVCTANSARSQLAAALWKRVSRVPVASAGTHPAAQVHPGAVATAARHGLPLAKKRPRPLSDVLADNDLVITVCDNAHEELGTVGQVHWSVPDPVPDGSDASFDASFEELARRIDTVAPRLTAL
jgi:ArsR family transcriptional regulator, arsenate/arsenite/antimonite-responsive transcriptional repressor / arsenate reductase (thioredoxin)